MFDERRKASNFDSYFFEKKNSSEPRFHENVLCFTPTKHSGEFSLLYDSLCGSGVGERGERKIFKRIDFHDTSGSPRIAFVVFVLSAAIHVVGGWGEGWRWRDEGKAICRASTSLTFNKRRGKVSATLPIKAT